MAEPARQALTAEATVPLRSRRFGDYEIPVERVLVFPDGLIGFGDARRFALLETGRPASPFHHLACLDVPDLGFVVCDPTVLVEGNVVRVWLGGGNAARPDENLNGQIGLAILRPVGANLSK